MNGENQRDPLEELASEFIDRVRRGDDVTPEDYAAAHPELADDILELFPMIVGAERLKGVPAPRRNPLRALVRPLQRRWAAALAAAIVSIVLLAVLTGILLARPLTPLPAAAPEPPAPVWIGIDGPAAGGIRRSLPAGKPRIAARADGPATLLHVAQPLPAQFTLVVEARGVVACGIADVTGAVRRWVLRLPPPPPNGDSPTGLSIEIQRDAAGASVRVNGRSVPNVGPLPAAGGCFFLDVPPGGRGEVRRFELHTD